MHDKSQVAYLLYIKFYAPPCKHKIILFWFVVTVHCYTFDFLSLKLYRSTQEVLLGF